MSDAHVGQSTARSRELYELAAQSIAGGVGSGTRAPAVGLPAAAGVRTQRQGAVITDEDGNTYVDYVMGQGPLILGHRHPAVIDAITETLRERGSLFSLAHDLEGQAAAAVTARMPSIELLRFGNSGTECVQYALRFARAFTGREKVLRFEGHYHGWSDAIHWSAPSRPGRVGRRADAPTAVPGSTGMPPAVADDADRRVVERHRRAASASSPSTAPSSPRSSPSRSSATAAPSCPRRATSSCMRELATAHGAVLIFDEVLTGIRVAPGGAQELLRHPPRPDGARQGARRRRARWPRSAAAARSWRW